MSVSVPIIALIASVALALSGATLKKFNDHEQRADKIELVVAREYLPKTEFKEGMDRLYVTLDRFERKLDNLLLGSTNSKP